MRSIKLYAAGSAAANNAANVTIPSATKLLGIQYAIYFDAVADNSRADIECSLASSNEIAVNGAQQCIAQWGFYQSLVTSGMVQSTLVGFLPVDVALKQGQFVYLHVQNVTTVTYFFTGLLWLRD
jgi:hypothetical protein